jgi:predicted permease
MVFPLVAPSVYVQIGPRVNGALNAREAAQFDIVGRLRPGLTRAQTSAALRIAALDLERRFPDINAAATRALSISPFGGLIERLPAGGARIAYTLGAALNGVVGLVLLVACGNVAWLLLSRAAERTREVAIRVALGATRARLVQQCLAESFVIATIGSVIGAMLWLAITTTLPKSSMFANSGIELIAPSLSLVQCGLLVLVVTLACGIGPAMMVNQRAPAHTHGDGVRRRGLTKWSAGQWLVTGQVGVSLIVLVGGCILLFSVVRQQFANPGFDLEHTVSVEARWPTTSNGPDFFAIRDALTRVPGVEAVSSGSLPVGFISFARVHATEGANDDGWPVEVDRVGPRYLTTMGIHLLRGRDFSDEDMRLPPDRPAPVIVGDTFARRYLGSIDVIDRQLVLPRDTENGTRARRLQIVGVSTDSGIQVLGGSPVPVLLFPALSSSFAVRVKGEPIAILRDLERAIPTLEPGAAVTVMAMAARLSRVLLPIRIATLVLGILGTIGLGLAMTGLYGMVSYTTQQRRVEIGLRLALGATWSEVIRLVLRQAAVTIGVGSAAGVILSLLSMHAISPLLAGQPTAAVPVAILTVVALTQLVGLGAVLRPAIAAASVDPMVTLRQE